MADASAAAGNAPLPDEPQALEENVRKRWSAAIQLWNKDLPIDDSLRDIEQLLSHRRSTLSLGIVDSNSVVGNDFIKACRLHDINLMKLKKRSQLRDDFIAYWRELISANIQYLSKVGVVAFTSMILLHGAVSVAAINALANAASPPSGNTALAAKLALITGVIGLSLTAVGQLIIYHFLSTISGRIGSHLVSRPQFNKIRAFSRYWNKGYKFVTYGVTMLYGSIFWFVSYALALAIVVSN